MRTTGDLATFVTGKTAGPFLLTLDVVFPAAAFPIEIVDP